MRRKKAEPTFSQRLATAERASLDALDIFQQAALTLESAADEAAEVEEAIEHEVQTLIAMRDQAHRKRWEYTHHAEKIREFLQ